MTGEGSKSALEAMQLATVQHVATDFDKKQEVHVGERVLTTLPSIDKPNMQEAPPSADADASST